MAPTETEKEPLMFVLGGFFQVRKINLQFLYFIGIITMFL